ncbi:hypothetical protein D3C80_1503930 [compost metagenome]
MIQRHGQGAVGQVAGVGGLANFGFDVQRAEQAARGGQALAHHRGQVGHLTQRLARGQKQAYEGGEPADGHVA